MKLTTALATLALALSSCAQLGLKQTLDTEVSELRSISSDLETSWNDLEARVAKVEQDVDAFQPTGLANRGVNLAQMREDILNGTNVQVTEAGTVEGQTADVEAMYEGADAQARADAEAVRAEAKRIMTELKEGIPGDITALTSKAAASAMDAARIKATADNLGKVGDSNPLMTSDDKETARRNRATIDAELNDLTTFADGLARNGEDLSSRLSAALVRFEQKVTGIGVE